MSDAISQVLVDAGATDGALSMWWGSPHPQLNHFSPRRALEIFPGDDSVSTLVLAVARRDALDLERMAAEPGTWASAAVHTIEPIGRGRAIERCRAEL